MRQHLQCRLHQKGYGNFGKVIALAFTATRCVVSDEGVTSKCWLLHDVGIVFFGRTKTMQEHNRRQYSLAMDGSHVQLNTLHRQRELHVTETFW
ncbi:hypothetical protein D3C86_1332410 [compost metagenome]